MYEYVCGVPLKLCAFIWVCCVTICTVREKSTLSRAPDTTNKSCYITHVLTRIRLQEELPHDKDCYLRPYTHALCGQAVSYVIRVPWFHVNRTCGAINTNHTDLLHLKPRAHCLLIALVFLLSEAARLLVVRLSPSAVATQVLRAY